MPETEWMKLVKQMRLKYKCSLADAMKHAKKVYKK